MKDFKRSRELFEQAQRYLVGGVDSPVRAFKAVGGTPLFIQRGKGSRIYDADGNVLVDYVGSWGPLILGHCHPRVMSAAKQAVGRGSSFGAPTKLEITLAQMISEAIPSVELVRFVTSGTEATMSAIRLARAFTGKNKIVKFAGCYHGHSDGLLAKAGSGVATLGMPSSPGVPNSWAADTLIAPYNNEEGVEELFHGFGSDIAAVIVEPIAGNMGLVLPESGFLQRLRSLTKASGSLLIFDEVITGFRVGCGGAQGFYGMKPDLTCLGKVIGGGFPVGAYGGRRDIMQMVAPLGQVYQAGTLAGNPVAMTAGIETLTILKRPGFYEELERKSALLTNGIVQAAGKASMVIQLPRLGSMFTVFFTKEPVRDYDTALKADTALYAKFFHGMLSQGIYLPPSQFETTFVSAAHTNKDIQATVEAASKTLSAL
jgi:glutamate-1-semialdehyde 2,1-aminomutase